MILYLQKWCDTHFLKKIAKIQQEKYIFSLHIAFGKVRYTHVENTVFCVKIGRIFVFLIYFLKHKIVFLQIFKINGCQTHLMTNVSKMNKS